MNGCEGFGREEKGIEEGKSYLRMDLGVDEDRIDDGCNSKPKQESWEK